MSRGNWVFAALYDRLNGRLEREVLAPLRTDLLRGVSGRVLDLGAGTGANLPYLTDEVRIVAAEPDPAMRRRLSAKLEATDRVVEVCPAAGEALPFADGSFDWVVCTCVLCSVSDPARTLAEVGRVLVPDGRLVVLEHVRGSGRLARWQDLVTPVWSRLLAGCHPNRDIARLVAGSGFRFTDIEALDPFPSVVPTRPLIAGVAVREPAAITGSVDSPPTG